MLFYVCSVNKGADQLCSNRAADQRLNFRIYAKKKRFSHDVAHLACTVWDNETVGLPNHCS